MTTASQGDPAEIERLAAALARIARTTRRQTKLPLGASSISALAVVVDQGATRLGDLAKIEGVTPATLSRIVAALEEEGYARRSSDESDRRSAFLDVTPAGRRMLIKARKDRAVVVSARVEHLTAGERELLFAALPALEALADSGADSD